tara:strand:+ start:700 stop:1248 length:549 start_codon:yes stop_codon:yes gene_type:complete
MKAILFKRPDDHWKGGGVSVHHLSPEALADSGGTEDEAYELLAQQIAKSRGFTSYVIRESTELPAFLAGEGWDRRLPDTAGPNRYFRDAVVWDDDQPSKCRCDMAKARQIHMDRIRKVRNAQLVAKDVEQAKAVEARDTSAQAKITLEKQTLRDIPQTLNLATPDAEALKRKWPPGLPKNTG